VPCRHGTKSPRANHGDDVKPRSDTHRLTCGEAGLGFAPRPNLTEMIRPPE
jgi:hypothetical protein